MVRARSGRRGPHRKRVTFAVRSFDPPRERPAPDTFRGRTLDGEERSVLVRSLTLVVAVKPQCDGCRGFIEGDLSEFKSVDVVLVCETADETWRDAKQTVLVAPSVFVDLEIRAAPFYVLIDPSTLRVVTEGTLFSPAQVAGEIASYVTPSM